MKLRHNNGFWQAYGHKADNHRDRTSCLNGCLMGVNEKNVKTPSKLQKGVSENSVPLNPMVNDHYPY